MTESNDVGAKTPSEVLREALAAAGASHALFEALRAAELDELPSTREEMFPFLEGPLENALLGVLHPASVAHVLATVRDCLAGVDKSGTRMRADAELSEHPPPDNLAATVPPPPNGQPDGYNDLVSGAVHSRVTPAWGLRMIDPTAAPGTVIWALVSNDADLQRTAASQAPKAVDVVAASSMAVLKGALKRAESADSAVVLDAINPSIELPRVLKFLTALESKVRVILWRMPPVERAQLVESAPQAYSWLSCEGEVTPREIIMLLGV